MEGFLETWASFSAGLNLLIPQRHSCIENICSRSAVISKESSSLRQP
jgi:hypothetical protein